MYDYRVPSITFSLVYFILIQTKDEQWMFRLNNSFMLLNFVLELTRLQSLFEGSLLLNSPIFMLAIPA